MSLVTLQDVQGLTPIPNSVPWNEIERYFDEAEWHDVRPFLNECGEDFWYIFTNNITDAKYQSLLNGTTYTNSQGNTIEFRGLKPAIVHYGYARYIEHSQLFATRSGMRMKIGDDSEPVSAKRLDYLASKERNDAYAYAEQAIDFLEDSDDYDWTRSKAPRTGLNMTGIAGNAQKRPRVRRISNE
jgi:hypothetical protein